MPYSSDAQRKFFHTNTAREKGISSKTVAEYDRASKGKRLPARKVTRPTKRSPAQRALISGGR